MSKKGTIQIELRTPARIRWGMFFYVNTCVLLGVKELKQAINDYKEAHNIQSEHETLVSDYYRLLELHRLNLQNE